MERRIGSIYAHFPFCETKCHYCDFYSLAADRVKPEEKTRFERALAIEGALRGNTLAPEVATIFFGGGTPSMTPPEAMADAIAPLWGKTRLAPDGEWTMESNPSSIERVRMEAYRRLGVNRVSIGVQSMRNEQLKRFGRAHDSAGAVSALTAVFEAGFTNVSADLLCGLPDQSEQELVQAIDSLTAFPLTHVSIYLLTLHKTHRMHGDLPDDETQLNHLLCIDRELQARGFEHYEISNFAKPGFRARHNMRYWAGESYLGLGPSAHSFSHSKEGGKRWKNVSSLHAYCEKLEKGELPTEWEETLTPEQERLERWMLGLRLADGFPLTWLVSPLQVSRGVKLVEEGLLEAHPEHPERIRPTAKGFALSDSLISTLSLD